LDPIPLSRIYSLRTVRSLKNNLNCIFDQREGSFATHHKTLHPQTKKDSRRRIYHVYSSSTTEFKAYMRTKEKLGGFDNMWKILKMEAEKKTHHVHIAIIDIELATRNSLKRAATHIYLNDELLNTFFSYMNSKHRNDAHESILSIH
jgi:hypothetical protein